MMRHSPRKALQRAERLLAAHPQTVLFVSPLLRAREAKMATALHRQGWKVVLIYLQNTPFTPETYFDVAIQARSEGEAHALAKSLQPSLCHAFSGAVDDLLLRLCRDKPGPLIIDLNDVFCPSLFNYCTERFEPTRECLAKADGLCARDLQARAAERIDGYRLPEQKLLFPEYAWAEAPEASEATPARLQRDEVHVASVGTFCLESRGEYDSCYLKLAELLTQQQIHFHIYPHWFYQKSSLSAFNWDLAADFRDYFELQSRSQYLHIHDSVGFDVLGRELLAYDFGIVAGGCPEFGQRLELLKPEYMATCYSGRIADYLDARLPVLINEEVRLNFRLLSHYRIGLDLRGVLRPGFREQLLEAKRDPRRRQAVEHAASRLSLARNAARLTAFYEATMAHRPRVGIPRWMPLAERLPVVGPRFRRVRRNIEGLHQTVDWLRSAQLQRDRRSRNRLEAARQENEAVRRQAGCELAAMRRRHQADVEAIERRNEGELDHLLLLQNTKLAPQPSLLAQNPDLVAGLLNWPEAADPGERSNGFAELLRQLRLFYARSDPLDDVSSAWELLGYKNLDQLLRDGYAEFKRTIATNYFTFLVQRGDPQLAFLESTLGPAISTALKTAAEAMPNDPKFRLPDQASYRYFVLLLWSYARGLDTAGHLDTLEEPQEGGPPIVKLDSRCISQDIANSVIEYYSMGEAVDFSRCRSVLEIGGGYGRNAYVTMRLHPEIRYTLVDIPPALYLAQRYLSSMFSERTVFRVQEFADWRDVADQMEQASIVFLLPRQLKLLPSRRFGLTINISSFGEMRIGAVERYFDEIDRVTIAGGIFYTKQWKVSKNPFDGVDRGEDDYPYKQSWRKIYSRMARVQPEFFEATYAIGDQ